MIAKPPSIIGLGLQPSHDSQASIYYRPCMALVYNLVMIARPIHLLSALVYNLVMIARPPSIIGLGLQPSHDRQASIYYRPCVGLGYKLVMIARPPSIIGLVWPWSTT